MAISELQIALIAAGAAAVALVWGYNVRQERRHRKTADRIFKDGQGDALFSGTTEPGPAGREPLAEDGERREPRFADDIAADIDLDIGAEGNPDTSGPAVEGLSAAEPEPALAPRPRLPAECADAMADCVLLLTAVDRIPAPAVWAMQTVWAGALSKPLHWLARNDVDGAWQETGAHDTGRYREWAVALQLVDRRGPVSEGELARFFDGVEQIAQQTGAALELPSRDEILQRAGSLDALCAAVDIQFVLHVVEASGGVFAGTKLRGVAEAAGLALQADGVFRAHDAVGGELFTVANLGDERLDADSITSLATHGLTLSLDVPRVSDGALAFDRMLATARQLAARLDGVLVDAQRAPLADVMIEAIRGKTNELQQRMRDGGIEPGSTRALRLFS